MPGSPIRIVLDTNTLLRGLLSRTSSAARLRRAAEGRIVVPLLSKPVLDEYRAVLSDRAIVEKFPALTNELVEIAIRRLRFLGDYIRSPKPVFEYRRDPRDRKFIELAIALEATHILSADLDLLSLPGGSGDAARRFRQRLPHVEVMTAETFVRKYEATLRLD